MAFLPPRYRAVLADHVSLAVAVLVVLALAGGYVAVTTNADDRTRTTQRTAGSWTVDTGFDHGATVTNGSAVYERGDRLSNRPLYFTRVTPVLEAEYVVRHRGTAGEPASVTLELTLVRRSVGERDGETVVFWRERESLSAENASVPDDEPLRVPVSVNVEDQRARITTIEETLGVSLGTAEVVVVADLTVEGTAGGETFVETRTDRLVLEPGERTYGVTNRSGNASTYEAVEVVERPVSPGPVRAYGSILLAVAAGLGSAGLVYAARRGKLEPSPAQRERIDHERAREEFDQWISPGVVPDGDRSTVRVASLRDAVDVAIDSNRRVIETGGGDRYVVIVDDVEYVFEPRHRGRN